MKILDRILEKLINTNEVEEINSFKGNNMSANDGENDVDFKALEILTIIQNNTVI